MHFKDFLTRQRVIIFIVGVITFVASLVIAISTGYSTIRSELFVNLAASSVTIIFTALIIDYFRLREESNKTEKIAGLAEDEIKATCFRIKWRLARLYGLERRDTNRGNISNHEEAQQYLNSVTDEVDEYLSKNALKGNAETINLSVFAQYLDRLQHAQTELEQSLILYEYAMSYSLRERVLALRSELQIGERLLSFIDLSEKFSEANLSLINITARSIYEAVEEVLGHDSRSEQGVPLHSKESLLK